MPICWCSFKSLYFFCRIMASKGKPENAQNYGISLATDDQKAMWKKVSARETAPSRYPIDLPLQTLGIMKIFGVMRRG